MQVEDPTYKSSHVFELCQDDDESAQFIKNDDKPSVEPRQGTPMLVMNSTGKEFFAAAQKKSGAGSQHKVYQPSSTE